MFSRIFYAVSVDIVCWVCLFWFLFCLIILYFHHQHSTSSTSSQDVEQVKRAFAKQRAKDLAEFAKNTMAKDRDIEELRKKCQQLTDKLATTHATHHVEVNR